MTNKEIISSFEGLQNLRQAATQRLPARITFAIIRNLKILQPIVEDIQIAYNELLSKYADPIQEQPGQFKVKDGCLDQLNEEMNALYSVDNDLPLAKIKFSDIENLSFSLSETDALYFMIEDNEEA